MLLLAFAAMPGQIEAATVDHGLRPEAAAEADLAAALCAELYIPHEILRVTVAEGNLQDAARNARYGALGAWALGRGLAGVATAHHADDQAETLMMRLNRGSGVAGLAAVRGRGVVPGSGLALLRPVLDWRRAELAQVLDATQIIAAQDPSNSDDRFDRVRMRRALAAAEWIDPLALANSARHLADADAALDWAAEREFHQSVSREGQLIRYSPSAPRAICLRVVTRIITQLGGSPRGGGVARMLDQLDSDRAATLGGVKAQSKAGMWEFQPESPRNTG